MKPVIGFLLICTLCIACTPEPLIEGKQVVLHAQAYQINEDELSLLYEINTLDENLWIDANFSVGDTVYTKLMIKKGNTVPYAVGKTKTRGITLKGTVTAMSSEEIAVNYGIETIILPELPAIEGSSLDVVFIINNENEAEVQDILIDGVSANFLGTALV
jgi:hypothetical protein